MDLRAELVELQKSYYDETKNKPSIEDLIKINRNENVFSIPPKWLTMIYGTGICQLCEKPEGNTHSYSLNYKCNNGDDKRGFMVCGKDECNFYIKTYIKILYNNIYITKKWQELLLKRANNCFVSVTRSSGAVENDWVLYDNNNDNENINTPVYDIMMTLILCCQSKNIFLPSELFEYIYNYLIYSYNDDIYLIINPTINNEDKLIMETLIKCFKGKDCKNIPIELL